MTHDQRAALWAVVNQRLPGAPRRIKQACFNDLRKKIEQRQSEQEATSK